ncbi:hypothetical protein COTS27_00115 [Spirochaetota bacterium]|nr:hypothetical protein COTS27_00115 [Spirochaetota bacterium]
MNKSRPPHTTNTTRTPADTMTLENNPAQSHEHLKRSILKAISWRIIASLLTFIITFSIVSTANPFLTTSALNISIKVTIIETTAKIVFYTLHERTWLKIPYGKTFLKS